MIRNKTKKKIISTKEINANSHFSQGWGLMFRSKQNLIMNFCAPRKISLHNFFVFYSLEVLIVNRMGRILEINRKFNPFTFWKAKHKGKYCIELGINESKGKCAVGDILELK